MVEVVRVAMLRFDLLYFQGRNICAMIDQILGLLCEFKERGCQTEKCVSQFHVALVDMGARVNEQVHVYVYVYDDEQKCLGS